MNNLYKEILEERWRGFDAERFVEADPLNVVYALVKEVKGETGEIVEEDFVRQVEVGALFVAMIAWGNRKMIKANALKLMELMRWRPYTFVISGEFEEYPDGQCVHRTLFGKAFKQVCRNLVKVYGEFGTLEGYVKNKELGISGDGEYVERLAKITAPAKLGSVSGNSACKRLCMFLRWMVRRDKPDLGLWRRISSSGLFAVLDVHVVRQAREHGLVSCSTVSWKRVVELTACYKCWCSDDPLKYDMVMMEEDLR